MIFYVKCLKILTFIKTLNHFYYICNKNICIMDETLLNTADYDKLFELSMQNGVSVDVYINMIIKNYLKDYKPQINKIHRQKKKTLKNGNIINIEPPNTCYVLKLTNDKYYIGITNNIKRRFNEHKKGYGSVWTNKYKPIEILETFNIIGDPFKIEYNKTIEYVEKYGKNNVYGSLINQIKNKT